MKKLLTFVLISITAIGLAGCKKEETKKAASNTPLQAPPVKRSVKTPAQQPETTQQPGTAQTEKKLDNTLGTAPDKTNNTNNTDSTNATIKPLNNNTTQPTNNQSPSQ